jgi:catechol 2,3-dioxygenase-like lactoylglutathione lyase family enzyme
MMMNMATADNNTGRGAGLPLLVPAVRVHHAALQTPNITRSIQFYGLFGFEEVCRFRAGPARAVWLDLLPAVNAGGTTADPPPCCRLELIEVPAHLFLPPGSSGVNSQSQDSPLPPPPPRALNVMGHPSYLGYHHLALDVTGQMLHESDDLASWIDRVNETSVATFGKSIRVALRPRQQLIGRSVYELAFLYDDTGCLVELLNHVADLNQPVASGWEPWDGRGFVGPSDSSSTAEYR